MNVSACSSLSWYFGETRATEAASTKIKEDVWADTEVYIESSKTNQTREFCSKITLRKLFITELGKQVQKRPWEVTEPFPLPSHIILTNMI